MYLTSFDINKTRRGAQKLLGSPQAMHAAVLAAFPPGVIGADDRVLWRIDQWPNRTILYVLSPARPDLTHLVEQAGWPTAATWRTADYKPLLEQVITGRRFGFRLTANPTHALPSSKLPGDEGATSDLGGRSKRLGHVTAAQQWRWLASRAAALGVDLGSEEQPTGAVVGRSVARFRRRDSDSGKIGEVTLSIATFQGTLVVTNASALRRAMVTGIGPAKAYGCGLLTLAPAGSEEPS